MSRQGIYSQLCWLDGRLQEATIYFEKGIITEIIYGPPLRFEGIINAKEKVLMPGIIDAHVHVNEPGRTDWEGFDTATQAAAAGGITTIIDMPLNASPVTTSLPALKEKIEASKGKLHVHVGFYGGLVPTNFNELEKLMQGGVFGIKAFLTHSGIDEFSNVTQQDLEHVMPVIANYKIPLLVHCELTDDEHMEALKKSPKNYNAYLQSRPKEWENTAIELVINLCRKYNCPVHIVHVSSAEALQKIKAAKKEGLPLTAETCPHYLFFSAEEIKDGETAYKCAPPIREKENNERLKEALMNGTLDFLATDHSPAPPQIKELESGSFLKAWGGIAGLQFLLPASWSSLKDKMHLDKFIPLLTEHPANFLKIDNKKGFLKIGFDADLAVWSPKERFEVKEAEVFHKHKISPYIGKELFGTIHQTYVGGQIVFENQKIINKNCGTWLLSK
jgi:allantoinase